VGGSSRNHGWPGGPAGIRLVTQGSYGDSRNSWSRRSSRDRRSFHFYARITQATSRASFRWQLLGGGVLATVLTVVCVLGAAAPAQAGWNAPVSISARGNMGPVRLAVNARGDAIAVWARVTRPVNLRRLQQGYAGRGSVQTSARYLGAAGDRGQRPSAVPPRDVRVARPFGGDRRAGRSARRMGGLHDLWCRSDPGGIADGWRWLAAANRPRSALRGGSRKSRWISAVTRQQSGLPTVRAAPSGWHSSPPVDRGVSRRPSIWSGRSASAGRQRRCDRRLDKPPRQPRWLPGAVRVQTGPRVVAPTGHDRPRRRVLCAARSRRCARRHNRGLGKRGQTRRVLPNHRAGGLQTCRRRVAPRGHASTQQRRHGRRAARAGNARDCHGCLGCQWARSDSAGGVQASGRVMGGPDPDRHFHRSDRLAGTRSRHAGECARHLVGR
jgi:hypothetical protein